MLNRILLALFILGSVCWISIVAIDIMHENNNYSPEYLFGADDEMVLIINRSEEVNVSQLAEFANAPMTVHYLQLNDSLFDKAYLSAKLPQLLLTQNTNWNEVNIHSLFLDSLKQIQFSGNEFQFHDLKGKFYKKSLFLYTGAELNGSKSTKPFVYDKKASASIIHFNTNKTVQTVTDIYYRGRDRSDYITYNKDIQQGNQRKDEQIFASFISSNVENYHFLERDYYASEDSIFANSPMFTWMMNGFVELTYKGSKAIVSDYIEGQDPVLLLNDIEQTLDNNRFTTTLSAGFPANGKSYFIKYLEDLVVISENEAVCDQLIADYKLGNTITLNKSVRYRIFGELPQTVSERFISKNQRYSKAVYHGKLLETQIKSIAEETIQQQKPLQVAMNCEFDIIDFALFPGKGNVVAAGAKGELKCFANGQLKWSKNLGREIIHGVELIDLYQTGELFILASTSNSIHLYNGNGDAINGFPIQLEKDLQQPVKFYRWQGSSYFLAGLADQEVVQFDGKGRELNTIKMPFKLVSKPDVWASQGQLFAGFSGEAIFEMYHLEKKRNHRTFALSTPGTTLKIPNELVRYYINDDQLFLMDQKGNASKLNHYPHGKLIKIIDRGTTSTIVIQSANELHLINTSGIPFGQITLPFNEVGDVFIQTMDSGKTVISVIDGLENNVYLYGLDGKLINDLPIEGQTKVQLNQFNSSIMVTTVVDQFVVQYFK